MSLKIDRGIAELEEVRSEVVFVVKPRTTTSKRKAAANNNEHNTTWRRHVVAHATKSALISQTRQDFSEQRFTCISYNYITLRRSMVSRFV
jgi:hypothetical protein